MPLCKTHRVVAAAKVLRAWRVAVLAAPSLILIIILAGICSKFAVHRLCAHPSRVLRTF